MQQLAAHRLGEAADRVLRAAVRRLERDAPVGEGRADLHDRAVIARPHTGQRDARAVHEPVVCDVGDTSVFVRCDVLERREHRDHRVVDPHVDRPEAALDSFRGPLEVVAVGHVDRCGEGLAAETLDVLRRAVETIAAPGDEPNARAARRERARRRPTDARGRAGDDDGERAHDLSCSNLSRKIVDAIEARRGWPFRNDCAKPLACS